MDNKRILIVGLVLALLVVIGILFFSGIGRHHDQMMSTMPSMSHSTAISEDTSPGARQFRETCTQCHGLPSPGQYTANEWPLIIERMKRHMIEDGIPLPDDKTTAFIQGFLEKNASTPSM